MMNASYKEAWTKTQIIFCLQMVDFPMIRKLQKVTKRQLKAHWKYPVEELILSNNNKIEFAKYLNYIFDLVA